MNIVMITDSCMLQKHHFDPVPCDREPDEALGRWFMLNIANILTALIVLPDAIPDQNR